MTITTIGSNTGDDFTGFEDTYIRSNAATTAYGTAVETICSNETVTPKAWHILTSISGLSNISASDVVSGAVIYQYLNLDQGGGTTADLRRLLVSWVEAEATYNVRSTGVNWTAAGAQSDGNDRSATISATLTYGAVSTYNSVSGAQLTTDIGNMVSGTYPNYGWLWSLASSADSTDLHRFVPKEGADGTRPYAVITHAAGGGSKMPLFINNLRAQGIL